MLGKLLIRKTPHGILAGRIVETEAYLGHDDAASHSAAGRTLRNDVLFGPPGYAYVYFIYGNHFLLNVSCLRNGVAGGVLFRAFEPVIGLEQMALARGIELPDDMNLWRPSLLKQISSGPGRMAEAMDITRVRDNGKNFSSPRSDLQLADDGSRVKRVRVTPRIGIVKSAARPLRYLIPGNPFVSGRVSSRL